MVGMSTFVDAAHPRGVTGKFIHKQNDAPSVALLDEAREWLPAGDGCTCLVNPTPFTHYGAVEPGDALEPDPDCPKHFPLDDRSLGEAEWMERNETWANDAAAGIAEEPDPNEGNLDAWASSGTPF